MPRRAFFGSVSREGGGHGASIPAALALGSSLRESKRFWIFRLLLVITEPRACSVVPLRSISQERRPQTLKHEAVR